jgi:hypothetical protein
MKCKELPLNDAFPARQEIVCRKQKTRSVEIADSFMFLVEEGKEIQGLKISKERYIAQ